MDIKELKIVVPEGYEIDQENSTFECIKFKPIKKELPKTWEEFCLLARPAWYFINEYSEIDCCTVQSIRNPTEDKNLLPTKELAEAMLALCQLIQLRDCYNDGWEPDWSTIDSKYCISINLNNANKEILCHSNTILAFKTEELRDEFLNNFKDLIEIAKPLL